MSEHVGAVGSKEFLVQGLLFGEAQHHDLLPLYCITPHATGMQGRLQVNIGQTVCGQLFTNQTHCTLGGSVRKWTVDMMGFIVCIY